MINLQNQRRKLKLLLLAVPTICLLFIFVLLYWPFTAAQTKANINNASKRPVKSKISHQATFPSSTEALHKNVITTVFWVGESASDDNGYISNYASAWDEQWQQNYGGIDNPSSRDSFNPKENRFYIALPYNDIDPAGKRKATSKFCPNAADPKLQHYSWCKNSWVAISSSNKTVYAQWEDVGPYQEDDVTYVFGNNAPKNMLGASAGLDISPSVRDLLGVGDVSYLSWRFVSINDVPNGPWRHVITTSPGETVD